MTQFFIDPQNGSDANTGLQKNRPRANPPVFEDNQEWLFAEGSTWDVPTDNVTPWFLKTPDTETAPWSLRIGSYSRNGERGQPKPILRGDPSWQHNMIFRDINLLISDVEFQGGFGTALQIGARRFSLTGIDIQNTKVLGRAGKGIRLDCDQDGWIDGALVSNNVLSRDLSIPWQDAGAGDLLFISAGVINSRFENNLAEDSGHTSYHICVTDPTHKPCYGNILKNNRATGFNSGHCRGASVTGLSGKCFNNIVDGLVSTGMTASDKCDAVATIFRNCSSDFGIVSTATDLTESVGNVIIDCNYPTAYVIARQLKTVRTPIFINMRGLTEVLIDDQPGASVVDYRFFNCEISANGTINVLGEILTIEEANQRIEFDLVAPQESLNP